MKSKFPSDTTLHSGNYGGQKSNFYCLHLQFWASGFNVVSMWPFGSHWNFWIIFNGWGVRGKTILSPLLKLKKLFANFAVFMSSVNVHPLAQHGDTWLVSMIMSLLVPVITNKLRHSPAHLVEKNAWNDVHREASKVTIVQCWRSNEWSHSVHLEILNNVPDSLNKDWQNQVNNCPKMTQQMLENLLQEYRVQIYNLWN